MSKLFIFFSLFISTNLFAQVSSEWLISEGGSGWDHGNSIKIDNHGNYISTGIFVGNADFDDTALYSFGEADIFVAKYNASGTLNWVKNAGGIYNWDWGKSVAVDKNDNIILGGFFEQTANFSDTQLISTGNINGFIAKYDPDGKLLWAKRTGNATYALTTDDENYIIAAGYFTDTFTFDGIKLKSNGERDIFLAKISENGEIRWIKSFGSPSSDRPFAITVDKSNNVFVTGELYKGAHSDSTIFEIFGNYDAFIIKFDKNGKLINYTHAGGTDADIGNSIICDNSGRIGLCGTFKNSATFGDTIIYSAGSSDAFVAIFDSNLNLLKVKSIGNQAGNEGVSLSKIENGYFVMTGFFNGDLSIDTVTLYNAGSINGFVIFFDNDLNFKDCYHIKSTEFVFPRSISCNQSGDCILCGEFSQDITCDTLHENSKGSFDIFTSKLSVKLPATINNPINSNEIKIYTSKLNNDNICINIQGCRAVKSSIELINLKGQTIFSGEFTSTNDNFYYKIDSKKIIPGLYLVKVNSGVFSKVSKIVIE